VPQIFIGDHHVGGFDDLYALDKAGKLDELTAAPEPARPATIPFPEDDDNMTEQTPQTQPAADPNAPVVNPQAVYIKDCSFESPNGPFLSGMQGTPTVNLNISTRATARAQDMHEVVLQVNLEAKAGDKVVWLLELQQGGAFLIRNLSATDVGTC